MKKLQRIEDLETESSVSDVEVHKVMTMNMQIKEI